MESLADTLARHALGALGAIAAIALVLTFVLWRLIERFGPPLWRQALRCWDALRGSTLVRRLRRVPGFGHLLTHALTATRYLGIHALVSFAVALGTLGAFFELADEIGLDEEVGRFDAALSESLATHLAQGTLQAIALITHLGDKLFLVPLGIVVTIVLLLKRQRLLAGAWAVATASGALLNLALKAGFERVRPEHEHGVVMAGGWSFPSGHASGAILVYGLLAYLLIRLAPRAWHLPVVVCAVVLIVFVGFGRVLLQVHYLSDVLAGYLSGAAWGLLWVAGLEAVRWRERS